MKTKFTEVKPLILEDSLLEPTYDKFQKTDPPDLLDRLISWMDSLVMRIKRWVDGE